MPFLLRKGQFATVCRLKKVEIKNEPKKEKVSKLRREQANGVDDKTPEEDSDQEYSLYRVSSRYSKPLMVKIMWDDRELDVELDTDASVSLISEKKAKLLTYTGTPIVL